MLLNFIKVDFRTKILVDKYLELISVGVKPSEILVLVQNSTLKKQFSDQVLEKINVNAIEKLNIHSFFSIEFFYFKQINKSMEFNSPVERERRSADEVMSSSSSNYAIASSSDDSFVFLFFLITIHFNPSVSSLILISLI